MRVLSSGGRCPVEGTVWEKTVLEEGCCQGVWMPPWPHTTGALPVQREMTLWGPALCGLRRFIVWRVAGMTPACGRLAGRF